MAIAALIPIAGAAAAYGGTALATTALAGSVAAGTITAATAGTLASLAGTVASAAVTVGLQMAFAPSLPDIEGPRLASLSVSAATEGEFIPEAYGRTQVPGRLLWATEIREDPTTEEVGGKSLGGGQSSTTFAYYCSFAMALAVGEIDGIGAIWADGKVLDLNRYNYTVYTGTETQTVDPTMEAIEGEGEVPAYRGTAYIVFDDMPLERFGNRIPQLKIEVIRAVGDTLSGTIQTIADDNGVTVDLTGVPSFEVKGYLIDRRMGTRGRFEGLAKYFGLGMIEMAAEELKFVPRYGTAGRTLTRDQMLAPTSGDTPTIVHRRQFDLPSSIDLKYRDLDRNYQTGVVGSPVRIADAGSPAVEETTMTMTEEQALEVATLASLSPSFAPFVLTFGLMPSQYSDQPGDIIAVPDKDGKLWRCQIDNLSWGGTTQVTAIACRADSVAMDAIASTNALSNLADEPTSPTVIFMDLPLLAGTEYTHTPHVCAFATVFQNVSVFYSKSGSNFKIATTLLREATTGVLTTAADDESSSLIVDMDHGAFYTMTQDDLDGGSNAIAIEDDGGEWAIAQFTTASETSPGVYTLTGLQFGKRGTEFLTDFSIGNRVVLLDDAVRQIYYPVALRGDEMDFRTGPATRAIDHALYTETTQTFEGVGLRPYAVSNITAVRQGSGNNIDVGWTRHSRLEPFGQDPEVDSEVIEHDITLVGAATTSTTVGNTDSVVIADTSLDDVTVTVTPVGRSYGDGPSVTATITVGPPPSP